MTVLLRSLLTAALLAGAASAAHAQHKFFVTDILDRGQTEIDVTAAALHAKTRFRFDPPLDIQVGPGIRKRRLTSLTANAEYGLGNGWQVGGTLPYSDRDRSSDRFDLSGATQTTDRDGWGDLRLDAKYLLHGSRGTPFTVAARADLKLDTADPGNGGSGSTDLTLSLFASARVGEAWRPYAALFVTGRNHGHRESIGARAGVYYAPRDALVFTLEGSASREGAERSTGAFNAYSASAGLAIAIARGWYVRPGVSVLRTSDVSFQNLAGRFEPQRGSAVSIGIYGLL